VLYGRDPELAVIQSLVTDATNGRSGVLVLRGEPGVGKTALLDHATAASGIRTLRGGGVEHEAEYPYAGLSLLLRPALAHLDALPGPQRDALAAAFGLAAGERSEPMFVGLAVLSLLSEYAGDGPLLCVVDDAQWLDRASRDALVFAARRLYAEGVALVLAARDDADAFPASGLTELRLPTLTEDDAAALLDARAAELSAPARARVLAEAMGNPLALIELPLSVGPNDVAIAARRAESLPLTGRLAIAFHGRVTRLSAPTGALLLLAALDDTGDLGVLLRAGAGFGADTAHVAEAERAELIVLDEYRRLTFRHPLIRAAVRQRAPLDRRLAAHRALADAFERPDHADRRAWHLASATVGTDESAAAALEDSGERARERSGHLAAALAYDRAARLTALPEARVRRLTLAAEAAAEAGELDHARDIAERAGNATDDEGLRARLLHVRALSEFRRGAFPTAHVLLHQGAALLAKTRPEHAARVLLQAIHTAWYLGEPEIAATTAELAALTIPASAPVAPVAAFVVAAFTRGTHSPPDLGDLVRTARITCDEDARELMQACGVGLTLGQDREGHRLAAALAAESRAVGGIGRLPTVLFFLAESEIFQSRYEDADATAAEGLAIAADSGQQQWVSQFESVLACLAAVRGDEEATHGHADAALAGGSGGAPAAGATWATWALGLLELGHGRSESALGRLEPLTREPMRHHICATRGIPDLVEAAIRCGAPDRAFEPLARLEAWAARVRQPWVDALVLRCRALTATDDDAAEASWRAALDLHAVDGRPLDRARTALLYGERLRRARRKTEARDLLRGALDEFDRLGARAWADRARTELAAIGGAAMPADTPRPAGVLAALTPQELRIARLAASGMSNRDIAAQLFLSPRTVGHHLYKTYPKLGIVSRTELAAIPELARPTPADSDTD